MSLVFLVFNLKRFIWGWFPIWVFRGSWKASFLSEGDTNKVAISGDSYTLSVTIWSWYNGLGRFKNKNRKCTGSNKYSLCCSAWFGFDINCFCATHKWALFKDVVCVGKWNCGTGNEFQGLIWMTWKVWLNSNKVVISESLGLASVF